MLIKLPSIDPKVTESEIIDFIKNKVIDMQKAGVVIGISGGVDSAVVSVLAKKAMDQIGKIVVGVLLPGDDNAVTAKDTEDARELCQIFNIPYSYLSLESIINLTSDSINPLGINKRSRGNMASRIRSNVLHTVAEIFDCLVCGTGNWDEDFGIGYYTLFGDGAVHISPIGNLSKRLVYQMAEYLSVPESIFCKAPSARLEDDQTDFNDLGYGYDMVEIVSLANQQNISFEGIVQVIEEAGLNFSGKFKSVEECIIDIQSRHLLALKKAQLVSPDIAKITLQY